MQRAINILILFLISTLVLKLWLEGKLPYYIHPRYTLWAALAAAIVFVAVPLAYVFKRHIHVDEPSKNGKTLNKVIIATLVLAIVIPPMPLSSFTALERFDPAAPPTATISYLLSSPVNPSAQNLTIREWIILLERKDADISAYDGRTVDLVGFLYPNTDRQFYVMRFVVTCCTADATPVGIPVQYTWSPQFKSGDWVEVKGKLSVTHTGSESSVLVIPTSVTAVAQPAIPYIY
jgi:putative membrane protein